MHLNAGNLCWSALCDLASLLSSGAQEAAGCPVRLGRGENGKVVTRKVRHPHGLGSLQQAESPSYLRKAQEESRRWSLPSQRALVSSGEEKC